MRIQTFLIFVMLISVCGFFASVNVADAIPIVPAPYNPLSLEAPPGQTKTTEETPRGDGSVGGSSLQNPLGGTSGDAVDPRAIIGNVIKAVLGIVGSLALAVFILGGFTWVTSAGNDEKVKKGKDMILWASLGLVVIFFAYVMVRFVITAVTTGGSAGG